MPLRIRRADANDADLLHRFIVELARYEREPDAVEVTPRELADQLAAESPPFEAAIALLDDRPVGFAIYCFNYSTWRGRRGLYLEDLLVLEEVRGRGVGRALLEHLARVAVERDCARMEWSVLDWNTPSIGFYRQLGAKPLDEWTTFRLDGAALARLAGYERS